MDNEGNKQNHVTQRVFNGESVFNRLINHISTRTIGGRKLLDKYKGDVVILYDYHFNTTI